MISATKQRNHSGTLPCCRQSLLPVMLSIVTRLGNRKGQGTTKMDEVRVEGAAGITRIVGKRLVQLPINNGMIIEVYHAPAFVPLFYL